MATRPTMHDMITLKGTHDRVFVLQRGVLDDRALLAFTGSQCHGLALAVHRRTGWPIVAVNNSGGECVHVCVRDPENRLVMLPARTAMTRWRTRAKEQSDA